MKTITTSETALTAAGILFLCTSTGNFLIIHRSPDVVDPSCWCGPGGKLEIRETPIQAAIRESNEEIGFPMLSFEQIKNPNTIHQLYLYTSPSLVFHNYLYLVDKEFVPTLNDESSGYVWTNKMMEPAHYGLRAIFNNDKAVSKINEWRKQ